MNIFFTNPCPIVCANEHCIVHTRKMIIEYAQLLSTAHRLLDGEKIKIKTKRKLADWYLLPSDITFKCSLKGMTVLDSHRMYKHTHTNHPSAVWVRQSKAHYDWLYQCFARLCANYAQHSGKQHATAIKCLNILKDAPKNLENNGFVQPPQCMPDNFKKELATIAYKGYIVSKLREWAQRPKPLNTNFYKQPKWVS